MHKKSDSHEAYDASDPVAADAAEARARRLADSDAEVVRRILATKEGRGWLWRRLEACRILECLFDDSANRMYWLLGERNAGLRLLAELEQADPDAVALMIREGGGE